MGQTVLVVKSRTLGDGWVAGCGNKYEDSPLGNEPGWHVIANQFKYPESLAD